MKMDLMKLIGKQWQMTIISIIVVGILSFLACGAQCVPMEKKIMQICEETDSVYVIPLRDVTDFKWSDLYIVSGPSFPEEVKEYIGLDYNTVIQDDHKQYIFIYEDQIVKEFSSTCMNVDLHPLNKGKSYVKLYWNDSIQVQKRLNEGHPYYEAIP
ncbi:MAG: hypothetical protein ACT6RE_17135 [Flavobacteriales bacterium]